ncbi:MAG: hypothetical protein QOI52_2122, partial [Chloroflexota bacterium]|nr:hypothetical protein [Chloroflexota bacterium]
MSVTLEEEPVKGLASPNETIHLRAYFWAVGSSISVPLLVWGGLQWKAAWALAPLLLTFTALTVAADLRPVNVWRSVNLSMSLPVTLAGAMVLPVWGAGLVAFFG